MHQSFSRSTGPSPARDQSRGKTHQVATTRWAQAWLTVVVGDHGRVVLELEGPLLVDISDADLQKITNTRKNQIIRPIGSPPRKQEQRRKSRYIRLFLFNISAGEISNC